jgi:hypothetical protein
MKKSCNFCTEPSTGESVYPIYGLAPHVHMGITDENSSFMGSTVVTGEPEDNFIPDPDEPGMGTWFCKKCGAGKPK